MAFNPELSVEYGLERIAPVVEEGRWSMDEKSPLAKAGRYPLSTPLDLTRGWRESGMWDFLQSLGCNIGKGTQDPLWNLRSIFEEAPMKEAALNALLRGKPPVDVHVYLGHKGVLAVLEDQGSGFDFERLATEAPPAPYQSKVGFGTGTKGCGLNILYGEPVAAWFGRVETGFQTRLLFERDLSRLPRMK